MVNATISQIYLMDEGPFHFISIGLVKWSKSRKTMKERQMEMFALSWGIMQRHAFDQVCTEKCIWLNTALCGSLCPESPNSPVVVALPDCSDLPLGKVLSCTAWLAQILRQPPQVYIKSMVICKCTQALNQCNIFYAKRKSCESHVPFLSFLFYLSDFCCKISVENAIINELSITPKEQGYVVDYLFQLTNVHSGRLSSPVIHIK